MCTYTHTHNNVAGWPTLTYLNLWVRQVEILWQVQNVTQLPIMASWAGWLWPILPFVVFIIKHLKKFGVEGVLQYIDVYICSRTKLAKEEWMTKVRSKFSLVTVWIQKYINCIIQRQRMWSSTKIWHLMKKEHGTSPLMHKRSQWWFLIIMKKQMNKKTHRVKQNHPVNLRGLLARLEDYVVSIDNDIFVKEMIKFSLCAYCELRTLNRLLMARIRETQWIMKSMQSWKTKHGS